MTTSVSFSLLAFEVIGAVSLAPSRIRVTFSVDPLQTNGAGVHDALNPLNYSVGGPGIVSVVAVAAVSSGANSIDLTLSSTLSPGVWTVFVNNVQTPLGASLAINSASFTYSSVSNVTELTAGSDSETAETVFRKHLHPAIKGANTDIIIHALSSADEYDWQQNQEASKQLYRSSASGSYLSRLGYDYGVRRPDGMTDEPYRQLLVALNEKLTLKALRDILRVFYGKDSMQAHLTSVNEPFALQDGQTLTLLINETDKAPVTFKTAQFQSISAATATEVAAVIQYSLRGLTATGTAETVLDATTGKNKVAVYSGANGGRSFIRCVGGTAQPVLQFQSLLDTYSGSVNGGSYTVVVASAGTGTTFTLTTTSGQTYVDWHLINSGDYVVIGPAVSVVPSGSYSVTSTTSSMFGSSLVQQFTVAENLGYTGSYTLASNSDLTFFRPTLVNSLSGNRSVLVNQAGEFLDVTMPATAAVTTRSALTAAYGREGTFLDIARYYRGASGYLHVDLNTPLATAPMAGARIEISGAKPSRGYPWVSAGSAGIADWGYGKHLAMTTQPYSLGDNAPLVKPAVRMSDGTVLFAGGVFGTSTAARLNVTDPVTRTDSTLASGAASPGYTWSATTAPPVALWNQLMVPLAGGAASVGGYDTSGATALNTAYFYNPQTNTWSSLPKMALSRNFPAGVSMPWGILVCGGIQSTFYTAASSEVLLNGGASWIPATMIRSRRSGHSVAPLADGRVIVVGGQVDRVAPTRDANHLAYWHFDETSGTTASDATGSFPLTLHSSASSASAAFDNIGANCLPLSSTQYASGTGSAGALSATKGEWTIQFFVRKTTANGALTVLGYGAPGSNSTLQAGIDSTGHVFWKWQHGAAITESGTCTEALYYNPYYTPSQYAAITIRKKLIGGLATVEVWEGPRKLQTWTGVTNADGGPAVGNWYVGLDPITGTTVFTTGGVDVDEVSFSPIARGDEDILSFAIQSSASRAVTNLAEVYDYTTNKWSVLPPCPTYRTFGGTWTLPDGRIAFLGGLGYSLPLSLDFPAVGTAFDARYWPTNTLDSFDIFDPASMSWGKGPSLPQPISDPVLWESNGKLYISASAWGLPPYDYTSASYLYFDYTSVYELDYSTMKWSASSITNAAGRDYAVKCGNSWVLAGGSDPVTGNNLNSVDIFVDGYSTTSEGVNGLHEVVSATTSSIVLNSKGSGVVSSAGGGGSSYIFDYLLGWLPAYTNSVTAVSRTSNVTTITGVATGLVTGQKVFVNLNTSVVGSGLRTILATDSSAYITYSDTGANVGSTATTGSISTVDTSVKAVLATATTQTSPGPYIYDVDSAFSVTGTASTVAVAILPETPTSVVTLASTASFPASGWIILDFGTQRSNAVRYIEKIGTNQLLMDFANTYPYAVPVGTTALLVNKLQITVPSPSVTGNLYATGSQSDCLAAQEFVSDSTASGISLNFNVRYPGDRGLGGEGRGIYSDVRKLWGK